ncbi:MAG: polymer-forming cytoskeletal protein [Candidatus Uhrbacteria bacterium]
MASSGQETIIAQGVKVEGDFTSTGDVLIDGEVAGTVRTAASLRVGETARISADVTAATAVIAGEIQGNVHIQDRLELLDTSVVHGDVECRVLTVAAGATVNGRVSMGGGEKE